MRCEFFGGNAPYMFEFDYEIIMRRRRHKLFKCRFSQKFKKSFLEDFLLTYKLKSFIFFTEKIIEEHKITRLYKCLV